MRLLIAIILSFFVLTTFVNAQSWPVDSFTVFHSVDFEDNSIGTYGAHPAEWEADWGETYNWFKNHNIVEVEQKGATKAMRFNYPLGTSDGVNQGTDFRFDGGLGLDQDSLEIYISSDVMLKPYFDPVISGKLNITTHGGYIWTHTGKPTYYEGFKVKIIWMKDYLGKPYPRFYLYHHDYGDETTSGETRTIYDPNDFDNYYVFPSTEEQWVNITLRVVMNTVNTPPANGNNDGLVEVFIDGKFASAWPNLRLRNVDTIGINQFRIYSQFGGSDPMFATTADEWILTDNYYIWNYDWDVDGVPRHNELSDSSRVLHLPSAWTNVTLSYTDSLPVISNFPSQTIDAGETFSSIPLDNYVSDPYNLDSELTWYIYDTVDLVASITSRVATITYPPGWTGSETIKFKVANTWGNADSVYATFIVRPTTLGRTSQQVLINLAHSTTDVPSTMIEGNYWNHMTFDEQVQDSIFDLYNTEGDNSDFDFTLLTSGAVVGNGVAGYRGTDYPDTCEYTYWLVTSTYADIELDGFEIGELYNVKTYSSYIGGDGGNTTVTFLDTAKVVTAQNNTTISSWTFTATDTVENLRFYSEGYGFLNTIEINQYSSEARHYINVQLMNEYINGKKIKRFIK